MSWLDGDERYLILTVPKGIDQHDIQGVLNGFSAASDKPRVSIGTMPPAYGIIRGMLLIPADHLTEIESSWAHDSLLTARLSLAKLTGSQFSSILNAVGKGSARG